MSFAKLGSISYVIWGLLHIAASIDEFMVGRGLEPGLVKGKINQGAWDLLFFALFAIVIAVRYNWKNEALGYWLNLLVVSAADIGFIVFVLLPGYVDIFPSILGPVFWILGLVFSTLDYRSNASG